jgi:hypothetical protein
MEKTKSLKRETQKSTKEIKGTRFDEAKVKELAYRLYAKRGYRNGNDWADWFEAEKRIKSGEELYSC